MAHMIPRSADDYQPVDWQSDYANAIKDPRELIDYLQLDPNALPYQLSPNNSFATRVPWFYAELMHKGDPCDPLLLQVLSRIDEEEVSPKYVSDPVGDLNAEVVPGLLHKYHGRVLLITTGACAVHCRYCFRRHFPYTHSNPLKTELPRVLSYINDDPGINEVILSGGDPLSLSNERLRQIITSLEAIPHLHTLRLHSRLPVVLPSRMDRDLLDSLSATRLKVVLVIHANHAQEISTELVLACKTMQTAGITLLNQSVLLKDVNNRVSSLKALSQALFRAGVLPYYLHLLDKVAGAGHFEVDRQQGLSLMHELRKQLPGYLVPRLVSEVAGEASKQPVI